jgi:hypothetical protein
MRVLRNVATFCVPDEVIDDDGIWILGISDKLAILKRGETMCQQTQSRDSSQAAQLSEVLQ